MKPSRINLFPTLLAIAPILSLFAQNRLEARLHELYLPVALMVACTLAVQGIARLIFRSPIRAAIATTLVVIGFETVAQVTPWLNSALMQVSRVWVIREFDVWPPLVITTWVVGLTLLGRWLLRRTPGERVTLYLNTFSAILVVLASADIARMFATNAGNRTAVMPAFEVAAAGVKKPDVYYIIMDGYARSDVMLRQFGFDNRPFLARLEEKGFYVARGSHSNYCQTPLSLSSSLNANYLDDTLSKDNYDKFSLHDWIVGGSVVRTFREMDYRFVTFATGFGVTDEPKSDLYLSPYPEPSEFQRFLLGKTPLAGLSPTPMLRDSYTMSRDRTNYLLKTLPEVARDPRPTFTFAHILSPHPPFVFGADGEDVSPRHRPYYLNDGDVYTSHYGDSASYIRGYRAQCEYLTREVERTIAAILENSPEPPIIILQSDHGSGLHLKVTSVDETDLQERMSILNCYYFPDRQYQALYQDMTPVNSFRVLFNKHFGSRLPLLPDRSYYSSWDLPFEYIDVTDRVKSRSDQDPSTPDT